LFLPWGSKPGRITSQQDVLTSEVAHKQFPGSSITGALHIEWKNTHKNYESLTCALRGGKGSVK
jgi:hypothetical protein